MYSLDYAMMSQVLQQFHYTGNVSSHVPLHPALGESGYVLLAVEEGAVLSCVILNTYGQKLSSGAEASRLLAQLGVLEWDLARSFFPPSSRPTSPSPAAPSLDPGHLAPLHHLNVPQEQLRTWSMLYRSVYCLCDGTHTSEQIRTLLSRPRPVIEQVIHDLLAMGALRHP
jgi:hypothetical protein